MKGEKAVIFCQKLIHLRMWHAPVCVCMTVGSCVFMCVEGKGGQTKRESIQKDKKTQVAPMEGKKESEIIGGWNWFSLNETFFFSPHNMSPHLGHHVSSFSILFSSVLASLFSPLNLSFFLSPYSKTASPSPPKTREHNPIHSYFRAYGIWKSLLHFSQSPRRTAVWMTRRERKLFFIYLIILIWMRPNSYQYFCDSCQINIQEAVLMLARKTSVFVP